MYQCAELTVSAIAVHSLASELSYPHRRLGPMVSGTQVDEVKNCNKGKAELTSSRLLMRHATFDCRASKRTYNAA